MTERASIPVDHPFPLRPDFLASVRLPWDLTAAEARRVAAMVHALALDWEETPT